jgi:uncharacterized protein
MQNDQIGPVALNERIELLDVLRGLAVCGILIGNMQWFSGYGMMPPELTASLPYYDHITRFIVHFLIEGKFYSIFSFLFGFGFALQIARAESRDDTKSSVFKRRLFWLLVIGLFHAYLLWAGDILSIYALMGFLLLLFRKKSNESLLKWAFWLIIVPIVTYILIYGLFVAFVPPDALAGFRAAQNEMWYGNLRTVTESSYVEIVSSFNLQYVAGRYAGLVLQMRLPKILAMFLLGMYFYRRRVFQDPESNRSFIHNVMIYGLGLGLIGNIAMAWLAGSEAAFPPSLAGVAGVIGYAFGVPALALGIVALVATLFRRAGWRKFLAILAPAGRMALTNYLLQTVVCVTIFYGYGFGRFGKYGALRCTVIALVIFAFQIAFSKLWLTYYAYGPMEWVWRQLTYRKSLPLRVKAEEQTV